jgi:hypothetical protein
MSRGRLDALQLDARDVHAPADRGFLDDLAHARLIMSREASVWSSSMSPTMLRSVVRVSVSSAYGRFCTE